MIAYYHMLFKFNNMSQQLYMILVHIYLLHPFFFRGCILFYRCTQVYLLSCLLKGILLFRFFWLLQTVAQYTFIKYIFGHNIGIFEFPTIEIPASKCMCILNYDMYIIKLLYRVYINLQFHQ